MARPPIWAWVLLAFFFFGGLGFTLWEETSWIGIGQIWIAVSVVVALIYVGAWGKIGEKLRGGRSEPEPRVWSPKPGGIAHRVLSKLAESANASGATVGAGTAAGADTAEQLQRLERLRASGDLTDAEYRTQRERIISGV
jgi:hypothetical protein